MLITHLELENFKSYSQERIDFLPGTNAIIGANGAGKSTLLEAVGFALFDHLESGMKLASLLREGAQAGKVVVGLVSSHDEREYEVERCFSAKTTSRYRIYDRETGQCIIEGAEDGRAWLHQHLRVEPLAALDTLFENTIGVTQGTFTAPFLQPASARKAIFDPLLQVEEYKKASDKLLETSGWLEREASKLQEGKASIQGQLLALPGQREELGTLAQAIAELEQRTTALQANVQSALQELQALDEAEARARDLGNRLQQVQASLTAHGSLLQSERLQLKEAEAAQDQVAASRAGHEAYLSAEERLANLEQQRLRRDQLRQDHSRQEATLAGVEAQLNGLTKELAEIAALAEHMQALEPLVERQGELEEALRQAEEEIVRLEAAQRREREAAEEVSRAGAVVERRTIGLEQAKALEQSLAQARLESDELSLRQQEAQGEKAATSAEMERLRKQSAALGDSATARCPVCEAELTPAHRDELLARNERHIQELALSLANLDERLRDYAGQISALTSKLNSGQKRLRALPSEDDLREAEQGLAERQGLWEQAGAEVAALAAAPTRVKEERQALLDLGDPRQEYQRCADRVRLGPGKAEEQRQAAAHQQQVKAQMARLETELAAFATLDQDLRATQRRRDEHREAHNTYMAHLKLAQQVQAHRTKAEQLAAELESLEKDLADLGTQQRRALAEYDAPRHLRVKEQLNSWQQELAACKAETREKSARLESVRQNLERLEALESDLAQKQAALEELQRLSGLVTEVRNLLKQAGPYVTRRLVQQVSREASAFYGDVIGDHSGRLQWSEDYELSLDMKGHKRTFRQLSGGEQMSAALALRLALLREASAIDVAFLDEPTAHLDPERREGLAERITQVKGFSQLFVISHDDTFERAAQNYIRIVKDERGSHQEKA